MTADYDDRKPCIVLLHPKHRILLELLFSINFQLHTYYVPVNIIYYVLRIPMHSILDYSQFIYYADQTFGSRMEARFLKDRNSIFLYLNANSI